MLWMYQRVFFGPVTDEKNRSLPDLSLREGLVLAPIIVFAIWLGVRPGLVLDRMEASIDRVLAPVIGESAPGAPAGHAGVETLPGGEVVLVEGER